MFLGFVLSYLITFSFYFILVDSLFGSDGYDALEED